MLARDAESHRHSVLLIEDDMDTRDAVEAFAEAAGFDVVAHHDAAMALNYLKGASHTCLILLDLYMPGMDGFAFRRAQLADPALADIPTVILSGGSLVDEKAARAMKLQAFFRKPVDPQALLAVLDEYCGADGRAQSKLKHDPGSTY